jgi:RsiW-degrading membrane proteinase PrsW (M82 family)
VAAAAILAAGSAAYQATERVTVMAVTSFAAMTLVCWAFYRFAARRLALDDTVAPTAVAAVAAATIGATLLIAANLNSAVAAAGGITTATATVGFIEEGTKLLVPLTLLAAGRFRDPRAGIAVGIAAGFGFAIAETTQYAYQTAAASGPDFCGGPPAEPTAASVIQTQVWRIFIVSPLHWLWTGTATAIVWRQWHLRGRRALPVAAGAVLAVMVLHSLNDTSATAGRGSPTLSLLTQLGRWALLIAMYLLWRATARKSTPPQRIGVVSRGWHPKHLGG